MKTTESRQQQRRKRPDFTLNRSSRGSSWHFQAPGLQPHVQQKEGVSNPQVHHQVSLAWLCSWAHPNPSLWLRVYVFISSYHLFTTGVFRVTGSRGSHWEEGSWLVSRRKQQCPLNAGTGCAHSRGHFVHSLEGHSQKDHHREARPSFSLRWEAERI